MKTNAEPVKEPSEHNKTCAELILSATRWADAMAEFAYVQHLPARAVFSPRYMLENDIDPDERIVE